MRPSQNEFDHLFQLPLGEFTAARNALAAKLKKAGRAEEAERIKRLLKPPASAWTVNQLYWRHSKDLAALMDNGDRFRAAQAAQLAGKPAADVRRLLDTRRQALTLLTKRAADILRASGHATTPETMRRIMTTLEALATYGTAEGAPPAGRLTDDLDPPGFEALTALVPRDGATKREGEASRVLQFRQETRKPRASTRRKLDPEEEARRREEELKAKRAAAREAVGAAEQTVNEARGALEQVEAALKQAAARAKAAEQEKLEAEQRFEQAAAAAAEVTREARAVARQAEEAAQAVSDSERELERARKALEEIQ